MKLNLKGVTLKIDWLMLLFPLIAALLGEGRTSLVLLVSLAAHESAHLVMARAANVALRSIRLTPFGGMAEMENPYLIPPGRLIAVAIAGPVANLLVLLTGAALCQWGVLPPLLAVEILHVNATLLLFNLFPALPLDGGRILWALLSTYLSRERALRIALWAGRVLAGLLIALAILGFAVSRKVNLSLLFAAAFILASSRDELNALANSRVQALLSGLRPIARPTPAEIIAVDAALSPREALLTARPEKISIFAVYQNGRLKQLVDEQTLLDQLTAQGDT